MHTRPGRAITPLAVPAPLKKIPPLKDKKDKKVVPANRAFKAEEGSGVIGKAGGKADSPFDNYFHIHIPDSALATHGRATLSYELYGLDGASQVTKSINGRPSYGGNILSPTRQWKKVTEFIPKGYLKNGTNEFYFTRRGDVDYGYQIRNLEVSFGEGPAKSLTLSSEGLKNYGGNVHISGFVGDGVTQLVIRGKNIAISADGGFETVLREIPMGTGTIALHYSTPKGTGKESVRLTDRHRPFQLLFDRPSGLLRGKRLTLGKNNSRSEKFHAARVSAVGDGDLPPTDLTIQAVPFKDLRAVNNDMTNVGAGDFPAYRLLRHSNGTAPVRLHLAYDPGKIPPGYSAKDIKTFAFNKEQKTWKALPVDSIDYANKEIISLVTNETDYINGVIKVPESPETTNFVPTTLSGMEYANPTSGVVSIAPPTPNSNGTASTGFPLKLPQGRNGMQPSLQVSYNSGAGNSWMGVGWNIQTPAISLNTKWGVPWFDPTYETELYSLEGSDLVLLDGGEYTNPHRTDNIIRAFNRQFFLRKEGGYLNIIRHGNTTASYWWEVTDTSGNKRYYGGAPGAGVINNTVIKKSDGDIVHWALYRSEDTYGNFVQYTYHQSTETVNGITGRSFYPRHIAYTRHTSGNGNFYRVSFKRDTYSVGNSTAPLDREDIVTTARTGQMQVTADLLTEVEVDLVENGAATRVRTYRFDYGDSKFGKKQLEKISEYDTEGNLFYSNRMEYHDDVGSQAIINTGTVKWEGNNDAISASPIQNVLTGGLLDFVPKGSVLGTSTSDGFSIGGRGGVGIALGGDFSTTNTIGGSYNYSESYQNTQISFLDINGDGLPDKVYKGGNGVYYRPNTGSGFGGLTQIKGLNRLSYTKSRTNGGGFDAVVGYGKLNASVGKSYSTTKSETDHYFTDFNGDGLVDMVSNNRVLFNTQNTEVPNADYTWREFNLNNIHETENPIVSAPLDPGLINNLQLDSLYELQSQFPQFDHVKAWTAPYTGIISIVGNATLAHLNNDGLHPNTGFKLTIEKSLAGQMTGNTQTVTPAPVNLSNQGQTVNMNQSNILVLKGEILYFRAHNKGYGYGGEVEWNPAIVYTSGTTHNLLNGLAPNSKDENGKVFSTFSADDDFMMNNAGGVSVPYEESQVAIHFDLEDQDFSAYQFSDDIDFIIERKSVNPDNGQLSTMTWKRTYLHDTGNFTGAPVVTTSLNNSNLQYSFTAYAESSSNVGWDQIEWHPQVEGNSSGHTFPLNVGYKAYNDNINESKYWYDGSQLEAPIIIDTIPNDINSPAMLLSHNLFTRNYTSLIQDMGDAESPVKINWVVKATIGAEVEVLHKRSFYFYETNGQWVFAKTQNINNSISLSTDTDYFSYALTKERVTQIMGTGGKLYSAFYVDNPKWGSTDYAHSQVNLEIHPNEKANFPNYQEQQLDSPIMAQNPAFYGKNYRGWGQFLYNGALSIEYDDNDNIVSTETFDGPMDMEVFTNGVNDAVGADDLQDNINETDPDNIDVGAMTTLRYLLYTQNNSNNRYHSESVIGCGYGYNPAGNLTATVGRFGVENLYDVYVDPNELLENTGNNIFLGIKQRSKAKGTATSGSIGIPEAGGGSGTRSEAVTNVLNQYIDLNGDRYPDIVTKGMIQFTHPMGRMSPITEANDFVYGNRAEDRVAGMTITGMQPNSTAPTNQAASENKTMTNVNSGINSSWGESFDSRQWRDINGDGLLDKITIAQSEIQVNLNLGYGFSNTQIWGSGYPSLYTSKRDNVSVGPSYSFTNSFAAGAGAARSSAILNVLLQDVNGDGLPDLIRKNTNGYIYHLNTGQGFTPNSYTFYQGNSVETSTTVSGNAFGTFTIGFPIFTFFGITIKATATATGGINGSFNEQETAIQDIDGDGLPDILTKDDANGSVQARLNRVGKTNLLKKVITPLGGSWTVDYERVGNTYAMPQSKWVLSEIKTHDGFTGDNDAADGTLTTLSYENGHYDRRDREFYGFGTLTTEQRYPSGGNGLFRYTVQEYHNRDYYTSGLLKSSSGYAGNGGQLSQVRNFYNLLDPLSPHAELNVGMDDVYQEGNTGELDRTRLLPALVKTISTTYENGTGLDLVQEFDYGAYGNVIEYVNYGTGNQDAYKSEVGYDNTAYPKMPTEIQVLKNNGGALLRKRQASYNAHGKPELLTTHLNPNETARVQLGYDNYGNLTHMAQLDNNFTQDISYDNMVHTYPVGYADAYGQSSGMEYDYLFGVPVLTTDMNDNQVRTRIDNRGRVVEVTGPKGMYLEYGTPHQWDIRMQYEGETGVIGELNGLPPNEYMAMATGSFDAGSYGTSASNAQHYAVTRHNVPGAANGQLLTISIVDGLGRALQVKKTHYYTNSSGNGQLAWQVSGDQVRDAFGRVVEAYLPEVQPYSFSNNPNNLNTNYLSGFNSTPVTMGYDVRDRKLHILQAGENTAATFEYGIDGGMFTTLMANERNATQETFTDVRGRQRRTVQNGQVTTEFSYNTVNELIRVRDTKGYETTYKYDLAGRRTEEFYPDRGLTTFTYDKTGNLIEKQTANLMQPGSTGTITYGYQYNRLTQVHYPNHPENDVSYLYGNSPGANNVGRVQRQMDASGVQEFLYDRMGNLRNVVRSIAVAGKTSYWFSTSWEYDSWNRVQAITYPDREEVTYHYNPGGALQSISTNMSSLQVNGAPSYIVGNIAYTPYGERKSIAYGNGTITEYEYDVRRRMDRLSFDFPNFDIEKEYGYDAVSNVTSISTHMPSFSPGAPVPAQLGGPVNHSYEYDLFNRLVHAEGSYAGYNDVAPDLLRQEYTLDMGYDESHNIIQKAQAHQQGFVDDYTTGLNPSNYPVGPVPTTSYHLDYEEYATATHTAGGQGYAQPHAPRKITEYPAMNFSGDPEDPRVVEKLLSYDADGNLITIKKEIGDPTDPLGEKEITLRENVWDEEDRLLAVDLEPGADANKPEVAVYTYDAQGERTIKYLPGRIDAFYSGKAVGNKGRLENILYPSPLLTVKALPFPEEGGAEAFEERVYGGATLTTYTKHYYVGSERVGSALGTLKQLGLLYERIGGGVDWEVMEMTNQRVLTMGEEIPSYYSSFGKELLLQGPYLYEGFVLNVDESHYPELYDAYWYHPDHLGSSSYITNLAGDITQHMEYLPFGETLVEEHLNSYNSPYKFNAKELDEETGWYYYGARYYNPKWSIWLSVDPLADDPEQVDKSPYAFSWNNPIRYVDPTGLKPFDTYGVDDNGNITHIDDKKYYDENGNEVDKLVNVDSNGDQTNKSIYVEKNVLSGVTTDKTSKGKSYDYFYAKNNKKTLDLFEFLATETDVEWSKVSEDNDSWIATSHSKDKEWGGSDLLYGSLEGGAGSSYEHIHSHPKKGGIPGYSGPSGFDKRDLKYGRGDKAFAKDVNAKYPGAYLKLRVYDAKTKDYILYDQRGSINRKKKP